MKRSDLRHFRCTAIMIGCVFSILRFEPTYAAASEPPAVHREKNGLVAVEPEHFCKQTATKRRAFHLTTTKTVTSKPQILPRKPNGKGKVEISGERMTWHKITLTLGGPYAHEQDNRYCFAKRGELCLVYFPEGGTTALDLRGVNGEYRIE